MADLHAAEVFAQPGPTVAANLASNPLADRFEVEAYDSGECDVNSDWFILRTVQPDRVELQFHKSEIGWVMTRAQFVELVRAGDVLIRNTAKNTGE
jgi:hypothetical protein